MVKVIYMLTLITSLPFPNNNCVWVRFVGGAGVIIDENRMGQALLVSDHFYEHFKAKIKVLMKKKNDKTVLFLDLLSSVGTTHCSCFTTPCVHIRLANIQCTAKGCRSYSSSF